MTKPFAVVEEAFRLHDDGCNLSEISRATGVTRSTLRGWFAAPLESFHSRTAHNDHAREACPLIDTVPRRAYAYLLAQYLGDGYICAMGPRSVFRLRISTCDDYPDVRQRCADALQAVLPHNSVGFVQSAGCGEVCAYSKHWPCLFPQHGPGRKHERPINLVPWQQAIVEGNPHEFVAGLIHSDGCRAINKVVVRGKAYEYPRYFFSNVSHDILMLCAWGFDLLGVEWKQNRWNCLSVAKRESVALLDTFIGPKS